MCQETADKEKKEKPTRRRLRKRSVSESGWQQYLIERHETDDDGRSALLVDKLNAEALQILERIKQLKKELTAVAAASSSSATTCGVIMPLPPQVIQVALLIPFTDVNNNKQRCCNGDAYAIDHAYTTITATATKAEPSKVDPYDWIDSDLSRSESEPNKYGISYFFGSAAEDSAAAAKETKTSPVDNDDKCQDSDKAQTTSTTSVIDLNYWLEFYGMKNRYAYVETPRVDDIMPFKSTTIKLRDLKKYTTNALVLSDCKVPRKRRSAESNNPPKPASSPKRAKPSPVVTTQPASTSSTPKRVKSIAAVSAGQPKPKRPRGRPPKAAKPPPPPSANVSPAESDRGDWSPVISLQQPESAE